MKKEAVNSIVSLSTDGSLLNSLSKFLTPFGKVADAVADLIGLAPKA